MHKMRRMGPSGEARAWAASAAAGGAAGTGKILVSGSAAAGCEKARERPTISSTDKAVGAKFDAVDDDIGFTGTQHVGQIVPLALLEFRPHAQAFGECFHQFAFEAGGAFRIVGGHDVGCAAFRVGSPAKWGARLLSRGLCPASEYREEKKAMRFLQSRSPRATIFGNRHDMICTTIERNLQARLRGFSAHLQGIFGMAEFVGRRR